MCTYLISFLLVYIGLHNQLLPLVNVTISPISHLSVLTSHSLLRLSFVFYREIMLKRWNNRGLLTPHLRNVFAVLNYSSKPIKKEKPDPTEMMRDFEKISNIAQKHREKKPQREPFVKNLLVGKFDTEILTYPELPREETKQLEQDTKHVKTVVENLAEERDLRKIWSVLSRERLLGFQTSQLIGGRESTLSEQTRLTEELSELTVKSHIISNENLAIQILTKFGNDTQKRQYLEQLVTGKTLSAFCLLELTKTEQAVLSGDGKTYTLNGTRKCVLNGPNAEFLIVFATTNRYLMTGFIVEKDFGGITCKKRDGIDPNVELCDVTFENTVIPAGNVIGTVNAGETILKQIYPQFRLSIGPVCSSINRKLIKNLANYFIDKSDQTDLLYKTDLVRGKLSKLVLSLYGIESALYLTTGLLDSYHNQDCELEAIITQLFSAEQTLENTCSALKILEPDSITENHWLSNLHKEAVSQLALHDPIDSLKIMVALMGLQHAGKSMNDVVKKIRNPFFFPSFALRRFFSFNKQEKDDPALTLKLYEHLHPSCINAANDLEYCVLRLQYVVEVMLGHHGNEVVNQHMELQRLADILIDIYVMTACLGRASRSYCIGLRNAEQEIYMAMSFCVEAKKRVQRNVSEMVFGHWPPNDQNFRLIADELFTRKHYYPVHPLTRNF